MDNMYRRIERFKGKRSRKGGTRFSERYAATVEELEMAEEIPETEYVNVPGADVLEPEIVRRKDIVVTAMTEQEAIEQMELLGHTFFVFYDATTGGVNVLYKRTNGDYGVLVPIIG
ncbi:MAG: sigma 54 modulation/S30EA ribosomal C-terminal domain-containing protein [Anaerolineae bacterium]|nr:sigma 54 modulation/S30EA ribosomal C-terminal domain-containing protein [Anaerolineae bacterium]